MNFHLSNKPGINTAVMQSTHPQQQRKMTMKKVVSTLMLSTAIVTSSISLPTHAAVIDTVKDKVIAIKKDTGSIKSQTSGIKTRVEEVRSSVNANIAETIDIRGALDPVFSLRSKFDEMGINPTDLVDLLPTDGLQEMIEKVRDRRAEMKLRLNDPRLETFRSEFVAMLEGINTIVTQGEIEASPLQTLVEQAPLPVLAALQKATDEVSDLTTLVLAAVEDMEELRDLGVFDSDPSINPLASEHRTSMTPESLDQMELGNARNSLSFVSNPAGLRYIAQSSEEEQTGREALICTGWTSKPDTAYFLFTRTQIRLARIQHRLNKLNNKLELVSDLTPTVSQIHGWGDLKDATDPLRIARFNIEALSSRLSLRQELIGHRKDFASMLTISQLCDPVTEYYIDRTSNLR